MDAPTTLSQDSGAVYEQHSVARTLVLHLLPGALILVFFVAIAPILRGIGFPPVMAIYLATVSVLIPFELGYLIYQASAYPDEAVVKSYLMWHERTDIRAYFE
jgi:hypothetical protein